MEERRGTLPEAGLTLTQIDERITQSTVTAANEIGYLLKQIRDRRLYKEAGSNDVYEYAQRRYGYATSTTSRLMAMNDKFSVGGNSPELEDRYRAFSKSQLMEMLPMTEEQIQTVDPGMTVKKIKEAKTEQKALAADPDAIRPPTAKEKKLLAQAAEHIVDTCADWLSEDEHNRVYSKKSNPIYQLYKHEIEKRKSGVSYGAEDEEYIYGVYILSAPVHVAIKTGDTLIGRFKPEYLRREIEKAYNSWKLEKAKKEQQEREKEEQRQKEAAAVPSSEPVVIGKRDPDPEETPAPPDEEKLLPADTEAVSEETGTQPLETQEEEKTERKTYQSDMEIIQTLIDENRKWVESLREIFTEKDYAVRKYQLMVDALELLMEKLREGEEEDNER